MPRCSRSSQPRYSRLPGPHHQPSTKSCQRLTQRNTLLGLQNHTRNQLHALEQSPVVVTNQITAIEAELVTVLADATTQEHAWAAIIRLLQTIPGIGLLTALWLVVSTLNCTVCDTPEQLAAYAG
jgi:transposase